FIIHQSVEKKKSENIQFWKKELDGYKRLEFTVTSPTPSPSPQLKTLRLDLGVSRLKQLEGTAAAHHTGIKDICFAAYLYMLSMLTYENDITAGLVTNNRPLSQDGDKILGCFLNTIPFRIKIPAHITWARYINRITQKMIRVKPYEGFPFFEIVKLTHRNPSHLNPIFDTLFNYIDFHVYRQAHQDSPHSDPKLSLKGYEKTNTLLDFTIDTTAGNFDLDIVCFDNALESSTVENLCRYYGNILDKFIHEPDGTAATFDILTPSEKHQLLVRFNDTASHYSEDKTIVHLLRDQIGKTPHRIALSRGNTQLSYRELDRRSRHLAQSLNREGVRPNTIVAIMTEPSIQMIIGILGILQAGGAYLPIDPNYPQERIDFMLKDSNACILLTALGTGDSLNATGLNSPLERGAPRYEGWGVSNEAGQNEQTASPANLAYIIYTSGSTGRPKGVMVEHRNLTAYIHAFSKIIPIKPHDIMIQQSSYAFDTFVEEIYPVLLKGAKLVIPGEYQVKDIHLLIQFLVKYNVTIIDCSPFLLNELNKYHRSGQRLPITTYISGGDVLKGEYVDHLITTGEVYNGYGPTESTVCISFYHYPKEFKSTPPSGIAPIGKPIANYNVYILDKNNNLLPIGIPGQLCTTGSGVARGYLNRP
ncbi:MAG: AMP-binding protein, partial [bacterium]|nr:AMP-binding protein [bacterium]